MCNQKREDEVCFSFGDSGAMQRFASVRVLQFQPYYMHKYRDWCKSVSSCYRRQACLSNQQQTPGNMHRMDFLTYLSYTVQATVLRSDGFYIILSPYQLTKCPEMVQNNRCPQHAARANMTRSSPRPPLSSLSHTWKQTTEENGVRFDRWYERMTWLRGGTEMIRGVVSSGNR